MIRPLCIYASTITGFAAAWALWRKFGADAAYCSDDLKRGYIGPAEGDEAQLIGRDVISLGVAPGGEAPLDAIFDQASSILFLDNRTDRPQLADLPAPVGNLYDPQRWRWQFEKTQEPPLRAIVDGDRSLAGIAWDVFHGSAPRPALISYVEDAAQDKFETDWSREINSWIEKNNQTFAVWDAMAQMLQTNPGAVAALARSK